MGFFGGLTDTHRQTDKRIPGVRMKYTTDVKQDLKCLN